MPSKMIANVGCLWSIPSTTIASTSLLLWLICFAHRTLSINSLMSLLTEKLKCSANDVAPFKKTVKKLVNQVSLFFF